jgi:uncharacterized protein
LIIDCHTHWGIDWEESHPGDPALWLAKLDEHKIDKAFLYGHANIKRSDMCSQDNDTLVRLGAKFPDRLLPVGSAWPQLDEKGIAETRRCIDIGVKAFKFHPWLQGFSTADQVFDQMIGMVGEANLPIFFHDGTPCYSLSEQIAGLARRHPRAKIVLGHSGLLWNWRSALLASRVPNVWLCLCGPHLRAIELICKSGPSDRIIWGSDFGFGVADQIEYRLNLMMNANIPADLLDRILGTNALALLNR